MYEWKEFKKITTYYNGVINGDKSQYEIRLSKNKDGTLKSTLSVDTFTFSFSIKQINEEEVEDFQNLVMNYNDFYNVLKEIKGIKTIDIIAKDNEILFIPEDKDAISVECQKMITRNFNGTSIGNVDLESFNYAFQFADNAAKSGIADFDKNFFFHFSKTNLSLMSYNVGIFVGNKFEIEDGVDTYFKISYDSNSLIKKWLKFVIKPSNGIMDDVLKFSIYQSFIMIKISHVSIIIPITFENAELISDKFEKLRDYDYPVKKEINFEKKKKKNIDALKTKEKDVDMSEIFENNSSIYRPLYSGIIKQFTDTDLECKTKVIESENNLL